MQSRYISLILCTIACCSIIDLSLFAQRIGHVKKIYNSQGNKVELSKFWSEKMAVFIFYSTECPLSIKYTKTVHDLHDSISKFADFYIVFSGKDKKNDDIIQFMKKYQLNVPWLKDPKYRLADALEAIVTPESFLVNNGKVAYRGAIDDWVIKLGSTKTEVREHYLRDAILALGKGKKVRVTAVKAIGCFIR